MEKTKEEIPETKVEETSLPKEKGKGLNIKVLLFGIPIFIVQLVVVYFITANVLLNKIQATHSSSTEPIPAETKKEAEQPKANSQELGKFVYMVEDLIINPANTDGKRLLLSSLGFDVSTEQEHQELKSKEFLLKDAVISIMSSKEVARLSNIVYRDTLRTEIMKRLSVIMPKVRINTIYFSKYILQ
jgi:flagellar FliL protein